MPGFFVWAPGEYPEDITSSSGALQPYTQRGYTAFSRGKPDTNMRYGYYLTSYVQIVESLSQQEQSDLRALLRRAQ